MKECISYVICAIICIMVIIAFIAMIGTVIDIIQAMIEGVNEMMGYVITGIGYVMIIGMGYIGVCILVTTVKTFYKKGG